MIRANDVRATDPIRHGAYLCLTIPPETRSGLAAAAVATLANRLGFENEFATRGGHPGEAIAFLRRVSATPAAIADDGLLGADAVVHVASRAASRIEELV